MKEIHCNGCGRRIGVTPNRLPGYVYCDDAWCARDFPISRHEERDALVSELARDYTISAVSRMLDLTRQRVQQIVQSRDVATAA